MAGYYRDKSRLFAPDQAKRGVVCVDDEWGVRLAREADIPVVTVATREDAAGRAAADWVVADATIGLDGVGSAFSLRGPGVEVAAHSPLPVSYTHLRAHETRHDLVCRLLLEKK